MVCSPNLLEVVCSVDTIRRGVVPMRCGAMWRATCGTFKGWQIHDSGMVTIIQHGQVYGVTH